jgi:hypothetical protein
VGPRQVCGVAEGAGGEERPGEGDPPQRLQAALLTGQKAAEKLVKTIIFTARIL